jgi:hypothetical protein
METILNLIKMWSKEAYWSDSEWSEDQILWLKDTMIDKAKEFLQWLIKNDHIEEIKSEKKSWPDINDYIKYIATTEDPMKTLSGLIK